MAESKKTEQWFYMHHKQHFKTICKKKTLQDSFNRKGIECITHFSNSIYFKNYPQKYYFKYYYCLRVVAYFTKKAENS